MLKNQGFLRYKGKVREAPRTWKWQENGGKRIVKMIQAFTEKEAVWGHMPNLRRAET